MAQGSAHVQIFGCRQQEGSARSDDQSPKGA
jgi:hypothetical protein